MFTIPDIAGMVNINCQSAKLTYLFFADLIKAYLSDQGFPAISYC